MAAIFVMASTDLTAIATLILAGIALALVLATIRLVVATRAGTAQAQADARQVLGLLQRQLEFSQRPLLVAVPTAAPPVSVSFEGAKIHVSLPLRNVGRGLAMIDGEGVGLSGPGVGALESRTVQEDYVPPGETTRLDLLAAFGDGPIATGTVWQLTVPYLDSAGRQRAVARLQIVRRTDDAWFVERVEQASTSETKPVYDEPAEPDDPGPTSERQATLTNIWGQPLAKRDPRK